MFFRLLLLFTTVPLIELALLVEIGKRVGLAATIALVLTTGVLGAWLAKREGLRTLARLRRELQQGRMPAEPLLDGLMILVAGAVLLTPGLLTDLFGFTLLIPPARAAVRRLVADRFRRSFAAGQANVIVIQPEDRGPM